jgi:hypothetical protein
MEKRAKRQKIGLTTQEKTTDYIEPRNPYINQHKKQTNTTKLLSTKSGTATSSPIRVTVSRIFEYLREELG